MRLLVTGGLGFIGSNFILQILKNNKDFQIINIDAEFFGSNKKSLHQIQNSKKYDYVRGNICDVRLMNKMIAKCDAVINFAAESFVDRSISNAKPFLKSNIDGVFTILEIIKKSKKRFVQISTDEVFGSLTKGSASEKSKFNPSSPYASTKAAAELLINSYTATYDCDNVITRCTNNFGPMQFPEKLIPKTILLAVHNQKIPIYGSGKNIRDWLYVTDHCNAILKVLTNGKTGESYNISTNNEVNNITLIRKILDIMGKSEDLISFVEDRPGHDFRYSLNSSKIRKDLKWIPKINFEEGLEKTIEWYKKNSDWWKGIVKATMNKTPWKN